MQCAQQDNVSQENVVFFAAGVLFDQRFEIIELLGKGASGSVYKARHLSMDRVLALKILPASCMANADLQMRFKREAQAMQSINSEYIATVHAFGLFEQHPDSMQIYCRRAFSLGNIWLHFAPMEIPQKQDSMPFVDKSIVLFKCQLAWCGHDSKDRCRALIGLARASLLSGKPKDSITYAGEAVSICSKERTRGETQPLMVAAYSCLSLAHGILGEKEGGAEIF